MRCRSETVLLLESVPYTENRYAGLLTALGYWELLYSNYADAVTFRPLAAEIDGVVAVWTDGGIAADRFARAVANATSLPRVRGALIVSPYATEENARLLMRSGAKGWARPPLSRHQLAGGLSCVLHGDRRHRTQPVPTDRRREPVYPLAATA